MTSTSSQKQCSAFLLNNANDQLIVGLLKLPFLLHPQSLPRIVGLHGISHCNIAFCRLSRDAFLPESPIAVQKQPLVVELAFQWSFLAFS